VAALVVPTHRRPPGIYRLARAFRVLGAIVLVILLIYVGTVAYSAYEIASSSAESHSLSAQFVSNGTLQVSGSFSLTNPGLYPIQSLELTARILNAGGIDLGTLHVGPSTVAAQGSGDFPIALSIPITEAGPAASLLTVDQGLLVKAWGNATYAYLFPLSIALNQSRSWGAPFEGLRASLGTPTTMGGQVTLPVTVFFADHASVDDIGTLTYTVRSSTATDCGGGSVLVSVPAGSSFDQTVNVALASGCSASGGQLLLSYATNGGTIVLPPEVLP
jgi:hypothetical protein